MPGIEVVHRRFIHLQHIGLEQLSLDRPTDWHQPSGGGMGPGVDGLTAQFDLVLTQEANFLPVVRQVVGVLVSDEPRHQVGGAVRPGDARTRRRAHQRRPIAILLGDKLLADAPTPEHGGAGDVEFVVTLLANLDEGFGIGGDLSGNVHPFDDNLEIRGKKISFTAAFSFCLSFVVLLPRCALAVAIFRRRLRLSQH